MADAAGRVDLDAWVWGLVVLTGLDVGLTLGLLEAFPGHAVEANAAAAVALEVAGWVGLVSLKAVGLVAAVGLYGYARPRRPRLARVGAAACVYGLVAVVVFNAAGVWLLASRL